MRRAGWLAYFLAALNTLAAYIAADQTPGIAVSLVSLGAAFVLAACGYALAKFQSRAAAIGTLVCTIVISAARWVAMGRPGPLIPAIVALYVFWQGYEAASEWARLRNHVVPTEEVRGRSA